MVESKKAFPTEHERWVSEICTPTSPLPHNKRTQSGDSQGSEYRSPALKLADFARNNQETSTNANLNRILRNITHGITEIEGTLDSFQNSVVKSFEMIIEMNDTQSANTPKIPKSEPTSSRAVKERGNSYQRA